jgi:cholestenol delta-isomerase
MNTAMESPRVRKFVFWWCVLSGLVHVTWELGFCLFHDRLAVAGHPGWMVIWTYYGDADTRYLHSDSFIVALEWFTVVAVTPMCFGVAYLIKQEKIRLAALLLLIFSTMELYGAILYFFSEHQAGWTHVTPASFTNFWLKVALTNGIWLVLPSVCAYFAGKTLLATGAEANVSQTRAAA